MPLLDRLRDRITRELASARFGVLSAATSGQAWSMPVRCRPSRLDVECLLPRWCDLANLLDDHPPGGAGGGHGQRS